MNDRKFICTNQACQHEVQRQNMVTKLEKNTRLGVQVKTTQAWCESCDTVYQVRSVLVNGEFEPVGKAQVLTGALRAKFMREIEPGRCETQVA